MAAATETTRSERREGKKSKFTWLARLDKFLIKARRAKYDRKLPRDAFVYRIHLFLTLLSHVEIREPLSENCSCELFSPLFLTFFPFIFHLSRFYYRLIHPRYSAEIPLEWEK